VIAVDTNILVYAHRRDSAWHKPAQACLLGLAEGTAAWLIPWPCVHEFLAIVTHARIYSPPSNLPAALQQVEHWMASPSVVVGSESPQHWNTLRGLALQARLAGPVFHDARVAAICLDHGASALWSADRDFSRFTGMRVVNPLVPA
jgi:uncharacterized protein